MGSAIQPLVQPGRAIICHMGIKQYWQWNALRFREAWRRTVAHLSWDLRQIAPLSIAAVLTAVVSFFVLSAWGTERPSAIDALLSLLITAAVSALLFAVVFIWHLHLMPYRMWLMTVQTAAAESEEAQKKKAVARQLAHELEALVVEGDAILYPLPRGQMDEFLENGAAEAARDAWHRKALALVERAGPAEKSMYTTLGGSVHGNNLSAHWGFLEPRIKKLRLIMQRQHKIADAQ
jgi:hypothetical protein